MSVSKVRYESPWEWVMEDMIKNARLDDEAEHDDEDDIPILSLMRIVMKIYEGVVTKNKEKITQHLEKIDTAKNLISAKDLEDQGLSMKILDHVINATKIEAFQEINLHSKAKILKCEIVALKNLDNKEKSTLSALKCIAFSSYHAMGSSRAIFLARNAIRNNENCAVLYYMLGKNLRRDRRRSTCHNQCPNENELEAFSKAYELSKNPTFGVCLAQCYMEMRDTERSKRMLYNILATNPKSCVIQLRLAINFMSYKVQDFEAAEDCLNYVKTRQPKGLFVHYKGLLLMKTNKYLEAARYLKEAADSGNFAAAINYVECCEKMNPMSNSIKYFEKLLDENKNQMDKYQPLCLHLAMYFYLKLNFFEEALVYFKKALEVDPNNNLLQNYTYTFTQYKRMNVYDFLEKDFLPQVQMKLRYLSEESKRIYQRLKTACKQKGKAQTGSWISQKKNAPNTRFSKAEKIF